MNKQDRSFYLRQFKRAYKAGEPSKVLLNGEEFSLAAALLIYALADDGRSVLTDTEMDSVFKEFVLSRQGVKKVCDFYGIGFDELSGKFDCNASTLAYLVVVVSAQVVSPDLAVRLLELMGA